MPSPFPGMDPYLEGYLWPDVHHSLADQIRRQLAPQIEPRYVARIALRFVAEPFGEESIGIFVPDVEVTRAPGPAESPESTRPPEPRTGGPASSSAIVPAPLVFPLPLTTPISLATVEIRDAANNALVTSIEVLSPVNRRGGGWEEYQDKRRRVLRGKANLLEIDLLREGRRSVQLAELPAAPYFVFLTRAERPQYIEVWPLSLREPLPVLPAPLLPPDDDAPLDLSAALATVYDEARYHLSIDYRQQPDPPLAGDDAAWAAALLGTNGR